MSDFKMPSMGGDEEAGTLVEWKVQPGDRVEKGQVIAAVETSKAVLDVEVFESGVVEELYIGEGTEVPVGAPLARIGDGSHIGKQAASAQPAAKTQSPEPGPVEPEPETAPETEPGPTPEPEKKAQRRAEPARKPATPGEARPASPAARRRAREQGIDLSRLRGSGVDGAIVLRDLEQAPAAKPGSTTKGFDRDQMRAAIAAAMSRSKREIPHFYLAHRVDLHSADAWLENHNEAAAPEQRILMSTLFMKATALALSRYPELNGHYGEDGFVPATDINLGMAVNLRGGGLVAPAILNADALTLPELMTRLKDLVRRARGGGLRSSEVAGGTATLTALGERGVDAAWGVIYPPQVAMIGFGRPRRRPMAVDDESLAVRPAVDVTLAADHRVCDGHLGGLFLNYIDELLQTPEAL